jgi:colanic acid/amylovoran biosynthesis glycosyltransferase
MKTYESHPGDGKPMKIGYLVPEFPGQTHIFFWRELLAFRERGAEVSIISTRRSDPRAIKHDFAIPASKETFYLHPPKTGFLYSFLHPAWAIRSLSYVSGCRGSVHSKFKLLYLQFLAGRLLGYCRRKGIRHIHGHSCANAAHILAMASLSGRLTYSLTLHGGLGVYGENHDLKMKKASFVSAVTRPLRDDIIKTVGLPPEKVQRISMGVDLAKFTVSGKTNLSAPLRFISIARLSRGKGHTYALQALKRLKDRGVPFSYVIVGGGEYEDTVRQEIASSGLEDSVVLTGTLSEAEIVDELGRSDVLLLTSFGTFEAAPVCVMEAMACGVPTITSIIGGTRDMIQSGKDGFLVEQKDVDGIEKAMMALHDDRDRLGRMGREARKRAEELFDYRILSDRLLEAIGRAYYSDPEWKLETT